MFFLISENKNIIDSTKIKKNTVIMMLKYARDNGITHITTSSEFNILLSEGSYLVQTDDEGFEFGFYKIIQTGYFRDYRELEIVDRLTIQDVAPVDTTASDEQRAELLKHMDLKLTHFV